MDPLDKAADAAFEYGAGQVKYWREHAGRESMCRSRSKIKTDVSVCVCCQVDEFSDDAERRAEAAKKAAEDAVDGVAKDVERRQEEAREREEREHDARQARRDERRRHREEREAREREEEAKRRAAREESGKTRARDDDGGGGQLADNAHAMFHPLNVGNALDKDRRHGDYGLVGGPLHVGRGDEWSNAVPSADDKVRGGAEQAPAVGFATSSAPCDVTSRLPRPLCLPDCRPFYV